MSKEMLTIKDFDLFVESVKPIQKITSAAKIHVDQFGVKICSKNEACRCEIKSNCLVSDNDVDIFVKDISNFIKLITSTSQIHDGDFSNVQIYVDGGNLKIFSKKFKTKFVMSDEDSIKNFIDSGFNSDLSKLPADFEFITNSNYIKRLRNHTFMFSDINAVRIYIRKEDGMNNNTIYSTIGLDDEDFENSVTFEFGMVTSGSAENNNIIIDFERLDMLNVIQSDEIKVIKPKNKNALIAFVNKSGRNGTFMNMTMVDTVLIK